MKIKLKLTGIAELEIKAPSPADAIKSIGPTYQGWHIIDKEAIEKEDSDENNRTNTHNFEFAK